MNLRRVRGGELLVLAGAACVIVSLFEPSYQNAVGRLDAWQTFGPAVVLLMLAASAAIVLFVSTVTADGPALPVSAGVWSVLLGLIAVIAALVRVFERPQHATELHAGAWLALVGAVAILLGAWQSLRDERTSMYGPVAPPARPPPEA